jgi:hypothetical protein
MPRKSNSRRNRKQKAGSRASNAVNALTAGDCKNPLGYSDAPVVASESSGNILTNFVKNNLGTFHKLVGGGKAKGCGCGCKTCTCKSGQKKSKKCPCKCTKCNCSSHKSKSKKSKRSSNKRSKRRMRGGAPPAYTTGEDRMNVGDSIPSGSTVPENMLQKAQKWWNGEYSIFTEGRGNVSYNPDMQLKCGGTDCTTPAKLDGNLTNPPLDLDHVPNPSSDPIVDETSLSQGVSTFSGYELDKNGINYIDPKTNPSHPDAYKPPKYDIPNLHAGGKRGRKRRNTRRRRRQRAGASSDWRMSNNSSGPVNSPQMSESQFRTFNKTSEIPTSDTASGYTPSEYKYDGELWRVDGAADGAVSGYNTLNSNMFGSGKKRRRKGGRKRSNTRKRRRRRQRAGASSDWRMSNNSSGPVNNPPMSETQFRAFNKTSEIPTSDSASGYTPSDYKYDGELWRGDGAADGAVSGYDTLNSNMFGSGKRKRRRKQKRSTKRRRSSKRKR